MIPVLYLERTSDRHQISRLLARLRLDPAAVALAGGADVKAVQEVMADVAKRGDDAVVDSCRKFDDPDFSAAQIGVTEAEMAAAAARISSAQRSALQRAISQVREYQKTMMPAKPPVVLRAGVEMGMRFTPIDSAGLYFPGGKASYPSTLVMLAVPAQVAGVKRIVVCSPPGKFGRSDLVLAACHELQLTHVFRAGGAAAIAAMAFGTQTIPRVDKIAGPGNRYVQLAKRALAGCVGIDGFLGPSEILVLADESADPRFVAADLIAQAEHDPGSCYLLTTSRKMADAVVHQIDSQMCELARAPAIANALAESSAVIIGDSMDELIDLANQFAAEHVNLQTSDNNAVLAKLRHAGAIFVGPYSPVAAGDYVAGPSHCLPTNTTARFSSGVSVYEFLKRASVVRYVASGIAADIPAIAELAEAEGLGAHAASARIRATK